MTKTGEVDWLSAVLRVNKRLCVGLPTPPLYGPQVSKRGRQSVFEETFGQTRVRGQETRAQHLSQDYERLFSV